MSFIVKQALEEMMEQEECFLCGNSSDIEFCFGCNEWICEECDQTFMLGPHKAIEHKDN